MSGHPKLPPKPTVPLFRPPESPQQQDLLIPSSSPAFGTPIHPIRLQNPSIQPTKPTILPVLLPPATLRALAFRTFTKKHNLTLNSSALQALATFIGKHCGSGWREEGLADKVLEETAKSWKKDGGGVIVEGDGDRLRNILSNLEDCMNGGRLVRQSVLSHQESLTYQNDGSQDKQDEPENRLRGLDRADSQTSLGISTLDVNEDMDCGENDPRQWMKVVGAFEQPRFVYSVSQKHFEKIASSPSLFPDPAHKNQLFRNRYNLIHQRLLRNESFQRPTITHSRVASLQRSSSSIATTQQAYKLTPIANLLGRGGSTHLLLGLLTISPTGSLALSDLTGSIVLDLRYAKAIPENGAWFTPGMIVLVDGVYEEDGSTGGSSLGGGGGVGGTIGGRFLASQVGGPPCERREITLGVGGPSGSGDMTAGGGFGWVDFLGVGSERATGTSMRRLEKSVIRKPSPQTTTASRGRAVIIGEVNLDSAKTLQALKKVFAAYTDTIEEIPMLFVLVGNFVQHAVMAGGGSGGSMEYKEYFDTLASVLTEFPTILQSATFVFVPGDNDPWASSFSAGAATALPRKGLPELLTSRVKRAFATANAAVEKTENPKLNGEAIWTSNPTRISLFGPVHEIVCFRDDISGRFRRSALTFQTNETSHGEPQDYSGTVGNMNVDRQDESEQINVDSVVEAAESHVPNPRSKGPTDPQVSSDVLAAQKLVKTVLDQGYLSPFPLSHRPVLWDFAGALQLYPLPTALALIDPEAPSFSITYEGCHVMNPGRLVVEGRKGVARWIEYDVVSRRGKTREVLF